MKDIIVSVRVPTPLVRELKKTVLQEHYKDTSELVRTIVRKRWLEHQGLTRKDFSKEELVKELETLLGRLRQ